MPGKKTGNIRTMPALSITIVKITTSFRMEEIFRSLEWVKVS